MDFALEYDDCVKMAKNICCDYYWFAWIWIFQNCCELFLEMVFKWAKSAIEIKLSLEFLFLRYSFLLFPFHPLHLLRMVIGWLPEEINLLVFKGLMIVFDKLCDLIVCYIVSQIILAIIVVHCFVIFLQLHSSSQKDKLHSFLYLLA